LSKEDFPYRALGIISKGIWPRLFTLPKRIGLFATRKDSFTQLLATKGAPNSQEFWREELPRKTGLGNEGILIKEGLLFGNFI